MSTFRQLSESFAKTKPKRRWGFGRRSSVSKNHTSSVDQIKTKRKAQSIIDEAKSQARDVVISAKTRALDTQTRVEEAFRQKQRDLFSKQTQLDELGLNVNKTKASLKARDHYLSQQKHKISQLKVETEKLEEKYLQNLLEVTNRSLDDVKQEIFEKLKKRLDLERVRTVQHWEDTTIEDAQTLIQELLITTMPHGANSYVSDYNPPLVRIPNSRLANEIKGTNNCNQDFFEKLLKVELVFDDDNKAVKINAQDSVDRELGRQTLEKLVKIGRINPAQIRRVHQKIKQELEKGMYKAGIDLCKAVGVFNLPEDIVRKLGKFKYRYSYGQNMIEHTLEETLIGISLAHEFGVDSNVVRLGCLFHDIGKVIYDDEGTHVETGVSYLKEHNMPQGVIDCVAQSHEDEPFSSVESIIVHIADGISGARPAARHTDHEFANRVKYLEETPLSYKGVKEAFAIQAGREVRVVVDPQVVTDTDIKEMATNLRDQIKRELTYPGSVTVNVIREVSASASLKHKAQTKAS